MIMSSSRRFYAARCLYFREDDLSSIRWGWFASLAGLYHLNEGYVLSIRHPLATNMVMPLVSLVVNNFVLSLSV